MVISDEFWTVVPPLIQSMETVASGLPYVAQVSNAEVPTVPIVRSDMTTISITSSTSTRKIVGFKIIWESSYM